MARVRTHTVRRGGKTYTRQQHDRRTRGGRPSVLTLSPGRAGRNAARAFHAMKGRKKAAAAVLATAAVTEIVGYLTFKTTGGALMGVGIAVAGLGGLLWMSARR